MRTDELIVTLASEAEAVQPLPPPAVRAVLWAPVAVLTVAAGAWLIGIRDDIATAATSPWFVTAFLLVASAAGLASLASLIMAVPGRRSGVVRVLALLLVVAWTVLLAEPLSFDAEARRAVTDGLWLICVAKVVGLAWIPAIVLRVMIRRAAPLEAGWTAGLATLAATTAAAAGVQLACPIDESAHLLLGHVAPVVGLCLAAGVFGRRLLPNPFNPAR